MESQFTIDYSGFQLNKAKKVLIWIHGRREAVGKVNALLDTFELDDTAFVLPGAPDRTWYPRGFMRSIGDNEPNLSNALKFIHTQVANLLASGFHSEQLFIGGFSQGACITAEYLFNKPIKFGGALILSGGLFGPSGTSWNPHGSLDGVPTLVSTSDPDEWIPVERVRETASVLGHMGGRVQEKIYPNLGHKISDKQIREVRSIVMQ